MPNAVLAAIEPAHPVIRSDGTPERDLLFVDDAVAEHLATCDLLEDCRRGRTMLLATLSVVEDIRPPTPWPLASAVLLVYSMAWASIALARWGRPALPPATTAPPAHV
jgi:hypothetical protein